MSMLKYMDDSSQAHMWSKLNSSQRSVGFSNTEMVILEKLMAVSSNPSIT